MSNEFTVSSPCSSHFWDDSSENFAEYVTWNRTIRKFLPKDISIFTRHADCGCCMKRDLMACMTLPFNL